MVKKPTITEAIRLNRLRLFRHVQKIEFPKSIIYEFGNSEVKK